MRQRAITAIFFALAMLGGVFGGKSTFFFLFTGISAACAWEFLGLILERPDRFFLYRRVVGTAVTTIPFLLYGYTLLWSSDQSHSGVALREISHVLNGQLLGFGLAAVLLLLLTELFLGSKKPFQEVALIALSFFYIGIGFAFLVPCAITPEGWTYKPIRVFTLLWLVWTNDTMAYLIGSQIGKNKLFERISPKKTWEGTIGGLAGTVLMAWGLSHVFMEYQVNEWIKLAIVAVVFGTLGDLVESLMKRSLGVKDSGNLLPGHGGMLDRFDAFIFALPFYWWALSLLP